MKTRNAMITQRKREIPVKRSAVALLIALVLLSVVQAPWGAGTLQAGTQSIWPMEGYDTRHTGQCSYDTSANSGTLEWKYKTGDGVFSSPRISLDGTVYAGSWDGYLYALDSSR